MTVRQAKSDLIVFSYSSVFARPASVRFASHRLITIYVNAALEVVQCAYGGGSSKRRSVTLRESISIFLLDLAFANSQGKLDLARGALGAGKLNSKHGRTTLWAVD